MSSSSRNQRKSTTKRSSASTSRATFESSDALNQSSSIEISVTRDTSEQKRFTRSQNRSLQPDPLTDSNPTHAEQRSSTRLGKRTRTSTNNSSSASSGELKSKQRSTSSTSSKRKRARTMSDKSPHEESVSSPSKSVPMSELEPLGMASKKSRKSSRGSKSTGTESESLTGDKSNLGIKKAESQSKNKKNKSAKKVQPAKDKESTHDDYEDDYDEDEDMDTDLDVPFHMEDLMFGAFGSSRQGGQSRLKGLLATLRDNSDPTAQLMVLQEVAEMLAVATEDMFTSSQLGFLCSSEFITGLVNIFSVPSLETEDPFAAGFIDDMGMSPELMLLSCRCLLNMAEANPGSLGVMVQCGAIKVLIGKLVAIEYIDLAEQVLSLLERISAEYPVAVLKERGLSPMLQYIDFFSATVQRSAMTTAANSCRGLSSFCSSLSRNAEDQTTGAQKTFEYVKDVIDVVIRLTSYSDKKVVEQSVIALSRMVDWVCKTNQVSVKNLLTSDHLKTIVELTASVSDRKSVQYSATLFSNLIRSLSSICRSCRTCASHLVLEHGILSLIRNVLTGSAPELNDLDEPAQKEATADTISASLFSAIVSRPVNELLDILNLTSDLLPLLPDDEFWSMKSVDVGKVSSLLANATNDTCEDTYLEKYVSTIVPLSFEIFGASVNVSVRKRVVDCIVRALWYGRGKPFLEKTLLLTRGFGRFVYDLIALHNDLFSPFLIDGNDHLASIGSSRQFFSRDDQNNLLLFTTGLQIAIVSCIVCSDRLSGWLMREGLLSQLVTLTSNSDKILLFVAKVLAEASSSGSSEKASSLNTTLPLERLLDLIESDSGSTLSPLSLNPDTAAQEKPSEDSPSRKDGNDNGDQTQNIEESVTSPTNADGIRQMRLVQDIKKLMDMIRGGQSINGEVKGALPTITLLNDVLVAEHQVLEWSLSISSVLQRKLEQISEKAGQFTVLSDLTSLCQKLQMPHQSTEEIAAILFKIASHIVGIKSLDDHHGVTGFELQSSGLLDIFSEYFSLMGEDTKFGILLDDRIRLFIHVFLNGPRPSSLSRPYFVTGSFKRLVSRLQDCISQSGMLPIVSIAPSYNHSVSFLYRGDSTRTNMTPALSQLQKTLRLKVQRSPGPSDNTSLPLGGKSFYISIHASAPVRALEAYLKGRIVEESSLSHSIGMDSVSAPSPSRFETMGAVSDEDEEEEEMELDEESNNQEGTNVDNHDVEVKDTNAASSETQKEHADSKGQPTPSTSYAAAAKLGHENMQVEIFYNGKPLSPEESLLKEIYAQQQGRKKTSELWGSCHLLTYTVSSVESAKGEENSKVKESLTCTPLSSNWKRWFRKYSFSEESISGVFLASLLISRICYTINHSWSEICQFGTSGTTDFDPLQIQTLPQGSFLNNKLAAQINRQLEEPLLIVADGIPNWCKLLISEFQSLIPFETRLSYMRCSAFGLARGLKKWQDELAAYNSSRQSLGQSPDTTSLIPRAPRQKMRISRNRIIDVMIRIMNGHATSEAFIEIEFQGEVGTGLGPTLEFYSLVSKELRSKNGVHAAIGSNSSKSYQLWRSDAYANDTSLYLDTKQGLFPAPQPDSFGISDTDKNHLHIYKCIGKFVAKALKDGRVVDLPLNPILLEFVIRGHPSMKTDTSALSADLNLIKVVDGNMYNSLKSLTKYLELASIGSSASESITVDGARVEDLGLDFTLPGYDSIELKAGGADISVNLDNLMEYLQLIIDKTLYSGVKWQIDALRQGFSSVVDPFHLSYFSREELTLVVCTTQEEDWSESTIRESLKANHGYNMASKTVSIFIEMLTSFDNNMRREFLQFITGSPRLPLGGFPALTPNLTIVRKAASGGHKPDSYLPSVMTCVNYLKVPEYSSLDIMKARFLTAMREGQGSFHLS